jgi:hypothetical protein
MAAAVAAAGALALLAAPALAWDDSGRHRPPRLGKRPAKLSRPPLWPVLLTTRAGPRVVVVETPMPAPPLLPGPTVGPVPSVQDLPAVAGIWRRRPAEPSVIEVDP